MDAGDLAHDLVARLGVLHIEVGGQHGGKAGRHNVLRGELHERDPVGERGAPARAHPLVDQRVQKLERHLLGRRVCKHKGGGQRLLFLVSLCTLTNGAARAQLPHGDQRSVPSAATRYHNYAETRGLLRASPLPSPSGGFHAVEEGHRQRSEQASPLSRQTRT